MTGCGHRNLARALLEGAPPLAEGGCANPPSHVPQGHGVARTLLQLTLLLLTSESASAQDRAMSV